MHYFYLTNADEMSHALPQQHYFTLFFTTFANFSKPSSNAANSATSDDVTPANKNPYLATVCLSPSLL